MFIIRKLILIVSTFIVTNSFSQSGFIDGFIINQNGDTTKGKIEYKGDLYLGKNCNFKDSTGKITLYSPQDIKAYRFKDDRYFVSREIKLGKDKLKETVFLEYLFNGKANVYYFKLDNSVTKYFIEKDSSGLVELVYEEGYKSKDDKTYFYRTTEHNSILKKYMNEAPQLADKINEIKQPEHNQLIKLASKYHKNICPDSNCTTYKKKLKRTIWAEVGVGSSIFSFIYLKNRLFLQGYNLNALMHFSIANTNNIYFMTGVNANVYEAFERNPFFISIPAHIEYMRHKGKIRPKASVGVSMIVGTNRIDYLYDSNNNIIPLEFSILNIIKRYYLSYVTTATIGADYNFTNDFAIGLNLKLGYEGVIIPSEFRPLAYIPFTFFNAELGLKYRLR